MCVCVCVCVCVCGCARVRTCMCMPANEHWGGVRGWSGGMCIHAPSEWMKTCVCVCVQLPKTTCSSECRYLSNSAARMHLVCHLLRFSVVLQHWLHTHERKSLCFAV